MNGHPFFRDTVTVFNPVGGGYQATVIGGAALTRGSLLKDGMITVTGKAYISLRHAVSARTFAEDSDWELMTDEEKTRCFRLCAGEDIICEGSHAGYALSEEGPMEHHGCALLKNVRADRTVTGTVITAEY